MPLLELECSRRQARERRNSIYWAVIVWGWFYMPSPIYFSLYVAEANWPFPWQIVGKWLCLAPESSGKKSLLAIFCLFLNPPESQVVRWTWSIISKEEMILCVFLVAKETHAHCKNLEKHRKAPSSKQKSSLNYYSGMTAHILECMFLRKDTHTQTYTHSFSWQRENVYGLD